MRCLDRNLLGTMALVLLAAGCGNDETAPSNDEHTPVSYTFLINGTERTPPFTFVAGQTVRVRLKFVNSQGEDLDDVETEHFAGLTFDPGSLATATRLSTNHYQFDVTGQAPGSGTVQVSFGHDELADEHTFPEAAVTVTP
jgi:hypothetical protein